ncbi:MAG: hypothetical protein BWY66_00953 [bacterium ADurb.Bin374]|nr:MAG: hypothetical protein BWY66_00953 [bacterium ADurb.Bin374]
MNRMVSSLYERNSRPLLSRRSSSFLFSSPNIPLRSASLIRAPAFAGWIFNISLYNIAALSRSSWATAIRANSMFTLACPAGGNWSNGMRFKTALE